MDRATYLPGEAAQVTLTVTNPASTPVVSLMPFLSSTSCLESRWKDGDEFKQNGQPECGSVAIDNSNTMTFGPGETKQLVLNSYDKLFDIDATVLFTRSVPTRPGTYAISFVYGASASAQVEYRVEAAKLEADAIAQLRGVMFTDHPVKVPPQLLSEYLHVLALRSNGESYICVSQRPVNPSRSVAQIVHGGDNIDFDDSHVQVGLAIPFKRVATSSASIVSVIAAADTDENLTIEWTDSDGRKDHLNYSASYPARSRGRNQ